MQIASILYLDRQLHLLQLCVFSGFLCGVNEVFTLLGSVMSLKSEDLIAVTSRMANSEIFHCDVIEEYILLKYDDASSYERLSAFRSI